VKTPGWPFAFFRSVISARGSDKIGAAIKVYFSVKTREIEA